MYKCYYIAIRHKESNWAKFLKQDLEGAVCAPAHLFHRVGNQLNCWVSWTAFCARFFIMKLNMPQKLFSSLFMLLKSCHIHFALHCSVVHVAHVFNFWWLKLNLGQCCEDQYYASHSIFWCFVKLNRVEDTNKICFKPFWIYHWLIVPVNHLTPMSDQERISPYNINTISSKQVMRIKNINLESPNQSGNY